LEIGVKSQYQKLSKRLDYLSQMIRNVGSAFELHQHDRMPDPALGVTRTNEFEFDTLLMHHLAI
jgi:hypothetical protein